MENEIKYTQAIKDLTNAFNEQLKSVDKLATNVTDLNNQYAKLPSDYAKTQATLSKNLKEVADQQIKISKAVKVRTSEEIVNNRMLAQNADLIAKSNSKLAGAYQRLNAEKEIASKRLQNLIVSGKQAGQSQSAYNREVRQATAEVDKMNKKLLQADAAVGKFNRNVGNYKSVVSGFGSLLGAFGVVGGAFLIADIAKNIFNTTKELESLDKALMQVTGTQQNFTEQQLFLRDISERFGLEIKGLTKQFTQFYVSAKDKISGKEIQNIFESVSKAGAVMGLSVDNQQRAFLALNQMMSKGSIQAEELRGQLGEALPGALGIMAKAVGVSERKLGEMMKAGELLASDVLPKFAKELEKVYNIENIQRVETLASETERMKNIWVDFVRSLNESETGGISSFFKFLLKNTNETLKAFMKINDVGFFGAKKGYKTKEDYKLSTIQGIEAGKKNTDLSELKFYESEQKRLIGLINENVKTFNKDRLESFLSLGFRSKGEKEDYLKDLKNLIDGQKEALNEMVDSREVLIKKHADLNKKYINKTLDINALRNVAKSKSNTELENEIKIIQNKYEKETKAVNNLTASKTKQIEKEKELLNFGSVDWVKKQISDIEKLQSSISTTNAEYKSFNDTLEIYKKWLDEIEKGQTTLIGSDKVKAPNTAPTTPDVTNGVKGMNEAFEATDRYKEKLKELEQVALDFAKSFETSFASDAGLTAVFDILGGKLDTFGDNWQAKTILIMEGLQEMYNFLNENSQQYFDAEYDRLEKQKNYALQFAGDSEIAKNEIEEQYAERRKKIAKKEAEYKKREALFNIGINTAQAILAVIARGGKIWEGAIVGALGIAQMAKVASAKIPEFWQGTQNAPEGLALVDEKQPEVHTDKKGNIKSLGEKKANYRWLDKGDKIYPSYASYFQSLSSKQSKQNYTQTLSSEDFKNGIDKLLQKDSVVISIDKNGFRNFVNGNNIQNNNVYFKGKIL